MTPLTNARNNAPLPFPRVCAHRGLSGLCPENTLPAFAAAVALGADEIELDVWASRDGELVVCHDDDVARTTNGQGRIASMTWAALQTLDAGSWFRTPLYGGQREPHVPVPGFVPGDTDWAGTPLCRVDDVFAAFGGRVGMNLHIKDAGAEGFVVGRIADLVRQHGLTGEAYLAGSADVLAWARRLAPDLPRCCLEGQTDGTLVQRAIQFGCTRLQFWFPHFTDADIMAAHDAGLHCNCFACNDAEEAQRCLDRGIDVILTDYTNRILPVTRAFRTPPATHHPLV